MHTSLTPLTRPMAPGPAIKKDRVPILEEPHLISTGCIKHPLPDRIRIVLSIADVKSSCYEHDRKRLAGL